MQKYLTINKKLVLILACLILFSGISLYFVAPTVFGGGGAAAGGGSKSPSKCSGCSSTYYSGAGMTASSLRGSYTDVDMDGKLSDGDKVRESGGGGRGGSGSSGGGGSTARACVITLQAPVVASGTPSMVLSWTPTPNGKVTLKRSGTSGSKATTLTLPDNAKTYTDTTASLKPGTYTYSVSFAKAIGKVKGASTSTVEGAVEESILEPETMEFEPVSSFLDEVLEFAFGFSTPAYADHGGPGSDSGDANTGRSDGTHGGGGGGFGGNSGGGGSSSSGYSCIASFKVVSTLTQCNDGIDNSDTEDTLIDQQDPGCHTDGNPGNPKTYDPTDTSEGNPNADLVPTVTAVNTSSVRRPVRVTASVKNTSPYYAVSNSLIYGWRDTSTKAKAPKCGKGGKNCFTENGHKFLRLKTYTKAYKAGQTRKDKTRSFRPLVKGQYEVCAIADYTNTVTEGSAGEANNNTCRIIVVTDDTVTPTTTSTIDGPLTIIASPAVMRKGQTSTVEWDTGGRTECTITNSTATAISFTDENGDPRMSDQEETPPLVAQTTYTITCTDPGFEASETATIRLLPDFREI